MAYTDGYATRNADCYAEGQYILTKPTKISLWSCED